jgi:hypothetical protein
MKRQELALKHVYRLALRLSSRQAPGEIPLLLHRPDAAYAHPAMRCKIVVNQPLFWLKRAGGEQEPS